jgi:hypothetical protein
VKETLWIENRSRSNQDYAFEVQGIIDLLRRYLPDARLSASFSALARSPRLEMQCGHDNNE